MIALAVMPGLLAGCTHASRITVNMQGAPGGPPIARIAVAPAVSSIGELIARALEHEGCVIDGPTATARLLAAHHLGDNSLDTPEGLEALASEKVDAVLIATPDYPGWVLRSSPKWIDLNGYPPERVAVRLIRTVSGQTVTAFVWENASSGMRGSENDLRVKRSVSYAVGEIADLVLHSIGLTPGYLIETSPDGILVISGVVFKKRGDCRGFLPGQRVRFTVGDPRGPCASAKLVLIRSGEECDVTCFTGN